MTTDDARATRVRELLALVCTLPVIAALVAWRWPTWPVTRWQASLGEDLAGLAVLALGGFVTIGLVGLVFAVPALRAWWAVRRAAAVRSSRP